MSSLALLVAGTFFMEFLDATIITTALPHMAASLGTTAVALNVAVSAYVLAVAVFILPSGWAADRYGARSVFTTAIVVFTLSSVLCGLAPSAPTFFAARVLQGVGGAMMVPVGRLVVLRTTAKQDLMRAIAVLTWPGLAAPLIGPPLGGLIADTLSWRWIFFLNLPLGVIGTLLALRLVPNIRENRERPFDTVGFVLGGAFCVAAMTVVDFIGTDLLSWRVVVLGAGTVALVVALRWHLRAHAHPLIEFSAFSVPTFRAMMLGGSAMRVLISTMPFMLPLLFQLGFDLDAFRAGLFVLALFAGNIGIKPMTSLIIRRFGFRRTLVGNGLLQAATMLGCAVITPHTPAPIIVALLVVSGASRSLQFTAQNSLVFADVPERWMGMANTLFSLAFQLALGFGVAVGAATLRLVHVSYGTTAGSSLGDFHVAFTVLAALTTVAALDGVRLTPDAGLAVSRRVARKGA